MTEPVLPVEWALRDRSALARGRALLHYADAVLFNFDEPSDGGRPQAAALLLGAAVEELTAAADPDAQAPGAAHAFWAPLCAEKSLEPQRWSAAFSRAGRPMLSREGVLELRRVAWAGLAKLEPPELSAQRVKLVRWLKVLAALTLALVIAALGYHLWRSAPVGAGLLSGKPFRLSSKLGRSSGSAKLLFHTERELSPWVEYDLLQPTVVQEVLVSNRSDCCDEAALPLVIEASDDQSTWRELARRTAPFSRAAISFAPTTARYLRLRVARTSYLHLEDVGAR